MLYNKYSWRTSRISVIIISTYLLKTFEQLKIFEMFCEVLYLKQMVATFIGSY